jgi:serine/threonine protein phosphatase PrpC
MESGAIYRNFGLGPALVIETSDLPIEDGDRVLLMTDGITKVFHCLEAADLIRDVADIEDAAFTLAQRSIAKGTIDDVTVMLIEYEEA